MTRRPQGFTLIEVLVVLSLFGIILLILGEGLRLGIVGTGSFNRTTRTQAAMVPVERLLRHVIERMDPGLYPEPPNVIGTKHTIVLTTELPDPVSGGVLTADVRLQVENGRLVLWWTRHSRGIPFSAPPDPAREVLLDAVSDLTISYAPRTGAAWQSAWAEQAMPGLVRFRLRPRGGEAAWPDIIVRPQREQAEE